jgi:transposase
VIQVAPQMRILVAIESVDLRKGIDGLAQLCREKLGADPFSGCLFIFRSRRATAIKVLAFDSCEAPRYVELTLVTASLSAF